MLRKDYIMRMLEDFIRVMARVVLKKETKNYTDAKLELDSLSQLVSGFGLEHLKSLGADGICYVYGLNKESELEKIYCSARILKEEAMILEEEGKTEESLKSFRISRELFELVSDKEFDEKEESLLEIEFLKNKINSHH
jgi:hypothetical protein